VTVRNRFSTQIDAHVQRRLRATVLGLQRRGIPITLAAATSTALAAWCDRMAEDYNGGVDFDPAPSRLPAGRPLEP